MRTISIVLSVILPFLSYFTQSAAAQPGWCQSARSETERAICATPALWETDACEDGLFRAKRERLMGTERKAFEAQERRWATIRDGCGGDAACIEAQYDARLGVLDPQRASACVKAARNPLVPIPPATKAAACMTGPRLTAIAGQTKVTSSAKTPIEYGGAIEIGWSLPRMNQAGTHLFLIGAVPDGVRFAREERLNTAAANFFALPGGARAPFDIPFGAGRTRVVIPVHDPDIARAGKLWVKPFIAGPLAMEWALIATGPGCSNLPAQPIATLGPYDVLVGTPQVVIQDFIAPDLNSEVQTATQALRLKEIELSADGRFRLEIFDRRYRLFEVRSGAKIIERSGVQPRFSPTGRFVVASMGDPAKLYPTSFEIIDLLAGRVVDTAGGPILGWSNGDALLLDAARADQGVELMNTLVDSVEQTDTSGPTRPYFSPGCGTCDAWASSNIRIDWDRLVALRSGNTEAEAKTPVEAVVTLASAKAVDADTVDDRKPLDAFLTRIYGRTGLMLDVGWHSDPQIQLTHVGRAYDGYVDEEDSLQPTSPTRPSQRTYLASRRNHPATHDAALRGKTVRA